MIATETKLEGAAEAKFDKVMMDEITARVSWYLPGTTCKQEEDGRYRLQVPVPGSGVTQHLLTPMQGSDKWSYEHWWTGAYRCWPRAEGEPKVYRSENYCDLGDTAQEIAEKIVFDYGFNDGTLYDLQEEMNEWHAGGARRRELKAA